MLCFRYITKHKKSKKKLENLSFFVQTQKN